MMNKQQKADTVESKLNEFDELLLQLSSAMEILKPFLKNHGETIRRMNNRSRSGKGIGEQISQLHKNFEGLPDGFYSMSDITKRLSELSREVDAQLLKNLPHLPQ